MLHPRDSLIPRWPERASTSERLSAFMKQRGIPEVLEWTFMYDEQSKKDGTPYNTTFFQDIGGVSYEEWKRGQRDPRELTRKVSRKFSQCREDLTDIRNQLEEDPDETKRQIEQEGLDYMIIGLQTAESSTAIELEKASTEKFLDEAERKEHIKRVEEWQTALYGTKISENPAEVAATLELMCTEYAEKKEFLSETERKRYMELYIRLTQELRGKGYADQQFPDMETYQSALKPKQHKFTKEVLDRCEKIEIPRAQYMAIWQFCIDAMGFKQQVRESGNVSSIYDGPEYLDVPSGAKYESKNLKEVLRLMGHEICTHYVNQDISERNGFQIRWAGNVAKEEGLAILMEWLFQGFKLHDLKKAGHSYPYILAGELLSKEERQELTELRIRMGSKWKSGDENFGRDLRIMRWYPLEGPWAQRKDCSYGRWANRIIEATRDSKLSIMDFNKGKFSVDDIASGRLDALISPKKDIFPLLIPEMILFTIGKWEQNFRHADFVQYLREKYEWDIPEHYLNSVAMVKMMSQLKAMGIMNLIPSEEKK